MAAALKVKYGLVGWPVFGGACSILHVKQLIHILTEENTLDSSKKVLQKYKWQNLMNKASSQSTDSSYGKAALQAVPKWTKLVKTSWHV